MDDHRRSPAWDDWPVTAPDSSGSATEQPSARPVCYRHPKRETYVRCSRCNRPICPDCMRDAAVGFQCPDCVGHGQRDTRQPRRYSNPRYVRSALTRRPDLATMTLIGINVVFYLAKLVASRGGAIGGTTATTIDSHLAIFGTGPLDIAGPIAAGGQYYRLLTAMFLHVSLIHIALNMYVLYLLGPPLESILGRWRYLALYFVGGLGGSALSYLTGQGGEGASGAIFALFAAFYIVGRVRQLNTTPILLLIVLNLVLSFVIPGIGYWAHIGGLVAGAGIGAAYAYAPRRPWRLPTQVAGPAVMLAAVIAVTALRTAALT
jgi:membrane associated rhomboid family serine protease